MTSTDVVLAKLPHTCRNCGHIGHLYRQCPHPIMSFGLICYREHANTTEYLMIQRKDSLSFMEFIRGKYSLNNIDYIKKLLGYMTHTERKLLETSSFLELWNIIWFQPYLTKNSHEYLESKIKFESLKNGYLKKPDPDRPSKGMFVLLKNLLQQTQTIYTEPEWGFPKGRRKLKEEDIDCALREFCEESGFEKQDIEIRKDAKPLEELFYGTNNILYRHVYYIARVIKNENRSMEVDFSNPHQAREIRKAQWFSFQEVLERIRPYNHERRNLFKEAHRQIHETHGVAVSTLSIHSNEFKPTNPIVFNHEKIST